jgi:hypothetical protein
MLRELVSFVRRARCRSSLDESEQHVLFQGAHVRQPMLAAYSPVNPRPRRQPPRVRELGKGAERSLKSEV